MGDKILRKFPNKHLKFLFNLVEKISNASSFPKTSSCLPHHASAIVFKCAKEISELGYKGVVFVGWGDVPGSSQLWLWVQFLLPQTHKIECSTTEEKVRVRQHIILFWIWGMNSRKQGPYEQEHRKEKLVSESLSLLVAFSAVCHIKDLP